MSRHQVQFAHKSDPYEFKEFTGERLINAYAETLPEGASNQFVIRWSHGLTQFSAPAGAYCRGALEVDGYLYAVFEDGVFKIDSAGVSTFIGYLSGQGRVFMARNAADPVEIGILTQTGRYYVIVEDVISPVKTSDLPTFNSLDYLNGYFLLTTTDGKFFNTGINDARNISGLDFATAEGDPDGLVVGKVLRLEYYLFGSKTLEVWQDVGASPGSPFNRIPGAVISKGTLAPLSVCEVDNTLYFVGHEGIVFRLEGYLPRRVSNHAVERAIAAASDPTSIEAGTYVDGGHTFYVISWAEATWVYDVATSRWHERMSYNRPRWRANVFVRAFNKNLCGTQDDGTIYEISRDVVTEGNEPVVMIGRSVPMGEIGIAVKVNSFEVDFLTGRAAINGASNAIAPLIEVRYSDDGGATWSPRRQLSIGLMGNYNARVKTTRLGSTSKKIGRTWEIMCSDPHVRAMTTCVADVTVLS